MPLDPQVDPPADEVIDSLSMALSRMAKALEDQSDALQTIARGSSDPRAREVARNALWTPSSGSSEWDLEAA